MADGLLMRRLEFVNVFLCHIMTLGRFLMPRRQTLTVLAIVLFAALGFRDTTAQHRAQLSVDLAAHEARRTTARARVIVHGTEAEVAAIAARHHLPIVRSLVDGAVVFANSRQVAELAGNRRRSTVGATTTAIRVI